MTILVQWPPICLNNFSEQPDLFSAEAKREPAFAPGRPELIVGGAGVWALGSGAPHSGHTHARAHHLTLRQSSPTSLRNDSGCSVCLR